MADKKKEKSYWEALEEAMDLSKNKDWHKLYQDHHTARESAKGLGVDKIGMNKEEALDAIAQYTSHYHDVLVKGAQQKDPKFADYRKKIHRVEALNLLTEMSGKNKDPEEVLKEIKVKGLDVVMAAYRQKMQGEDEKKFSQYLVDSHIGQEPKKKEYFAKELIKRNPDFTEEEHLHVLAHKPHDMVERYFSDRKYKNVKV